FFDADDAHVFGQLRVECARDRQHRMRTRHRRARDLPYGMHTRIRASGAVHGHWRTLEMCERVLEQTLDRRTRRLTLPPDEPRSVVGDGVLERAHGRLWAMGCGL